MIQTITQIIPSINMNDKIDVLKDSLFVLQKNYEMVDKRIDDMYLWTAILVGFIVIVLATNPFISYFTAKNKAKEELKEMKGRIKKGAERVDEFERKVNEIEKSYDLLNKKRSEDG